MKPDPEWWRTWFGETYLAIYDETLRARTPAEVDGIERLARVRPPARVLDEACGQGRHAIELARRGYQVTGLDLSDYLLGVAAERARSERLSLRWVHGDMRQPPSGPFDLVLNLFTALGYFEDDADNQAVLNGIASVLAPGGRLVLEVLNGDWRVRDFEPREWFAVGKIAVVEERTLDASGRRMRVRQTVEQRGEFQERTHVLRLYGSAELEGMLHQAGFNRIDLYGDWDGSPVLASSTRILAIASRDD
ncbi:MAG TPA: class I SAM-dependent methyltransferase [Candidatus Limnocylindrales bacterium]|nr:class I SAM-dependent methyltransferase [Candidatus Limnocylindrales bacterium]